MATGLAKPQLTPQWPIWEQFHFSEVAHSPFCGKKKKKKKFGPFVLLLH